MKLRDYDKIRSPAFRRKLERLVALLEIFYERNVRARPGSKWVRLDCGAFSCMVDVQGKIYGIRDYGQMDRSCFYGKVDTICPEDLTLRR